MDLCTTNKDCLVQSFLSAASVKAPVFLKTLSCTEFLAKLVRQHLVFSCEPWPKQRSKQFHLEFASNGTLMDTVGIQEYHVGTIALTAASTAPSPTSLYGVPRTFSSPSKT